MKEPKRMFARLLLSGIALVAVGGVSSARSQEQPNPNRNAYFGDTHGHSSWSTDAFGFGNRLSPENAYRFARGEPAYHALPSGEKVQLHVPLDFYMMTDHSEMMGMASQALDSTSAVYATEIGKLLRANTMQSGAKALFLLQNAVGTGVMPPGYTFGSFKDVWQRTSGQAARSERSERREVQNDGRLRPLPWRQ